MMRLQTCAVLMGHPIPRMRPVIATATDKTEAGIFPCGKSGYIQFEAIFEERHYAQNEAMLLERLNEEVIRWQKHYEKIDEALSSSTWSMF